SPTEAAVVAVVYAIIVGVFIYRELSMSDLYECFRETVTLNAITMIVISLAIMMSYIMTSEQIPALVGEQLTNISENPIIILLFYDFILLIGGIFFDTLSAITVLPPILLPIAQSIGVDPVHFGVIMVANLAIGFVTPPLGANLYVASSVSGVKIEKIVSSSLVLILSMIITLLLITFIPGLSL